MKHTLKGFYETKKVYLDGTELDETIVDGYQCHADNFDWGQTSDGEGRLALAIMIAITGNFDGYQKLKHEVISILPEGSNFEITFHLDSNEVRQMVMSDAMATNKYLTVKYLSGKSNEELLAFVHPMYRTKYATDMGLKNYI